MAWRILAEPISPSQGNHTVHPLRYPTETLATGPSLGNSVCFARTTPTADLDHLWMSWSGRWYFGGTTISITADGLPLRPLWTEHRAESVCCLYEDAGLQIRMSVRLPYRHAPAVALRLIVRCAAQAASEVRVEIRGTFGARPSPWHRRQPSPEDVARSFAPVDITPNCLTVRADCGDLLRVSARTGELAWLAPDSWRWTGTLHMAGKQREERALLLEVLHGDDTRSDQLRISRASRLRLSGMDETIARAVQWAVINSERVAHRFRAGYGFTNDPPGTLLVTRDMAWFVFGADWYMPAFCRRMLDAVVQQGLYPSGKVAEYLDMRCQPAAREDYGLNIADPTPLFLLAVRHHAACTGDTAWLSRTYPSVRLAAAYLQSQTVDGLVMCRSTEDTPGRGQCGWRNVLQGLRISGSVTELQALSASALRAAAEMAAACRDVDFARGCTRAADLAAEALESRLFSPQEGRYLLCLGESPEYSGPSETLDGVFPLLFGLAPADVEHLTAERLRGEEWQCPTGLRTAPSRAPGYHPSAQWGLVGGSWPNATAWAAAALVRASPEESLRLTRVLAALLFPKPGPPERAGALVPGQFAEWFDGESGKSLGMAMSPWMPPTFVWLVLEGLLGLRPTLAGLQCERRALWPGATIHGLMWHGHRRAALVDAEGLRWL